MENDQPKRRLTRRDFLILSALGLGGLAHAVLVPDKSQDQSTPQPEEPESQPESTSQSDKSQDQSTPQPEEPESQPESTSQSREYETELPQPEHPLIIRLVDETHPITEREINQLIEPNLILLKDVTGLNYLPKVIPIRNENVRVHQVCLSGLTSLVMAHWNDTGGLIFVANGFRSLKDQEEAFKKNGQDLHYSATPGASQHHTGLAIDFTSAEIDYQVHSRLNFQDTTAGKWLQEHAWEHGFVESYINGHDGKAQEPWHYLYVGKNVAAYYHDLKENGWGGDVFDLQSIYLRS